MQHQDLTMNHVLESWTYPNAGARQTATGFDLDDVGRIAYQQDTATYWRLLDPTPTWGLVAPTVPRGGAASTILTKNSTADFDALWLNPAAAAHGIPAGGTTGQQLRKNSNTDYDTGWFTPSAGTEPAPNVKTVTMGQYNTNSTTGVMFGFGAAGLLLTPVNSGILLVMVSGSGNVNLAGQTLFVEMRYGTGTPPAQGAPFTGTVLGPLVGGTSAVASAFLTFSAQNIITPALVLGTQYWFDVQFAVTAGIGLLSGPTMAVVEL